MTMARLSSSTVRSRFRAHVSNVGGSKERMSPKRGQSDVKARTSRAMHECIGNITGLTNRIMLLEQRIASDHGPRGHEGSSGLVDKKFFQPEPLGHQDVF